MLDIVIEIVKILGLVIGLLLGIAYLTVMERKYMSSIQRRRGLNVVGLWGLLQAISDGVKLIVKEGVIQSSASKGVYIMALIITLSIGIMGWGVMLVSLGIVGGDINIGIMYMLGISSLGVYGVIMGGWGSNSRYGLLGGLRSTAQMISYEVSIGFTLVTSMIYSGTMNLTEMVLSQERIWNVVGLLLISIIFVISILAETNRHLFDLLEAEAELVSGYNVEYSGAGFALFFLGEYGNMILMSGLGVILFLGGWLIPFNTTLGVDIGGGWGVIIGVIVMSIKVLIVVNIFIWARAGLLRYRYDQLMDIGWKGILLITMGWVLLCSGMGY